MIKERLIQVIEFKKISKEDFYKRIGMTSASFRGKLKESSLNSDAIERIISEIPDLNPDWLLTGKGDMLRTEVSAGPPSANQAEILELLRWKVERLEEENKKLKDQISSLKRELDQSPPGIRKSELKK